MPSLLSDRGGSFSHKPTVRPQYPARPVRFHPVRFGQLGFHAKNRGARFLLVFGVFGGLLHAAAVPALAQQGVSRPGGVSLTFFAAVVFVVIGSLAVGVASIRARPRSLGPGLLIIVCGLALLLGHPVGSYVEDLGLMLLMGGLGWSGLRTLSR